MSKIDQLTQYVMDAGGSDLHASDLGPAIILGWEDFPVRFYQYQKTDPDGIRKCGKVALLDAQPDRIARWIYNAIVEVKGGYDNEAALSLVHHCADQSGFQFPVRGIHWENLSGVHAAYTFFDGVTVRLKNWSPSWPTAVLTQSKIDETLSATIDDVTEAMIYARIQSTTRQEYINNGGTLHTEGKQWISVVRDCYQAAWNSENNELMTAKARSLF